MWLENCTGLYSVFNTTQDEDCNGKDNLSEEDGTSVIQTVHYLYIQVGVLVVENCTFILIHHVTRRLFLGQ